MMRSESNFCHALSAIYTQHSVKVANLYVFDEHLKQRGKRKKTSVSTEIRYMPQAISFKESAFKKVIEHKAKEDKVVVFCFVILIFQL